MYILSLSLFLSLSLSLSVVIATFRSKGMVAKNNVGKWMKAQKEDMTRGKKNIYIKDREEEVWLRSFLSRAVEGAGRKWRAGRTWGGKQ